MTACPKHPNKKQDPLKNQTIQKLKKYSKNTISKHFCRNLCTKKTKKLNIYYIAFLVPRKQNKNGIVIIKMYELCTLKCVLHKASPATYYFLLGLPQFLKKYFLREESINYPKDKRYYDLKLSCYSRSTAQATWSKRDRIYIYWSCSDGGG